MLWADPRWNAEWLENAMILPTFIPGIGIHPSGMAPAKNSVGPA